MRSFGLWLKRHSITVAATILLCQAVFYYGGSAKEVVPAIAPWRQFPDQIGEWRSAGDLPIQQAVLMALQPDDYLARNYVDPGDPHVVNLFVGYYNSRRDGRAPHSPQWCLPGSGWTSVSSKVTTIPVEGEPDLSATEYLIKKGSDRELVLYWYHQGANTVPSDVLAQFYSLPDLLLHRRTDTALVRVIVSEGKDPATARTVALRFVRSVYPLIRKHIT
jgi:EpsI family protein